MRLLSGADGFDARQKGKCTLPVGVRFWYSALPYEDHRAWERHLNGRADGGLRLPGLSLGRPA